MELFDYKDKRVVVCGCYSGMGEATTKLLLALGAEVHGLDYQLTALKLASFSFLDLRDPASVDKAISTIAGPIDGLFMCAGLPHTSPPLDVMKVNYIGTRYLVEKMIPYMATGGAIAIISSRAALNWVKRMTVLSQLLKINGFAESADWCDSHPDVVREGYSLSKEAIVAWAVTVSGELIKRGIRINCTLAGTTETPMIKQFESVTDPAVLSAALAPTGRRATPMEQAAPVVFLNSDSAGYINGAQLPVDGGFSAGVLVGQIIPANR